MSYRVTHRPVLVLELIDRSCALQFLVRPVRPDRQTITQVQINFVWILKQKSPEEPEELIKIKRELKIALISVKHSVWACASFEHNQSTFGTGTACER